MKKRNQNLSQLYKKVWINFAYSISPQLESGLDWKVSQGLWVMLIDENLSDYIRYDIKTGFFYEKT